jgi:hypothetical protein
MVGSDVRSFSILPGVKEGLALAFAAAGGGAISTVLSSWVFCGGAPFSGVPQRGQNAAVGDTSPWQRGQRGIAPGAEAVLPCTFFMLSNRNGRSGWVLCGSIGRTTVVFAG